MKASRRVINLAWKLAMPVLATIAVLFVLLVAFSLCRRDSISFRSPNFGWLLVQNRMGGVRVAYTETSDGESGGSWNTYGRAPVLGQRSGLLGFSWQSGKTLDLSGDINFLQFTFPHWFAIALTCGLMIAPIHRKRRLKRQRQWAEAGCCVNCGYDLRASPSRCPECGEEILAADLRG